MIAQFGNYQPQTILFTICSLFLILATACKGGKIPSDEVSLECFHDISGSTWTSLSNKKIFFGHQSVGFNIVDGMKDLMKTNPQIKLNIVETNTPADLDTPVFAHTRVGKNRNPQSKIDSFSDFMDRGMGDKANIALFKFCYVDITSKTDVEGVFQGYQTAMSLLKKRFPKTTFVHVTVPLTSSKTGLKPWVKRIIGREDPWGFEENIRRNQFNGLLRKGYQNKEPIFDLAEIESTLPDGTRQTFSKDGNTYYSLIPDYSNDGGHLNELGRKIVAGELLLLLATLSTS
jgi:hypothetical protein